MGEQSEPRGYLSKLFRPAPLPPMRNELILFGLLGFLGVLASYISVNIPNTEMYFEIRWAFGFMGFALLRRRRLAVPLAFLLSISGFHRVSLWIALVGNMLYAVPALVTIRLVHVRFLSRIEHLTGYGIGWFLLVLLCYQIFSTPLIILVLAVLRDVPVWPQVLTGWLEQPLWIESLIVATVSSSGMMIFRSHSELRRSKEELSITLDSIGDGVIVTDRQGFVVRMNPVAETLTGCPIEEAPGKPLKDVFRIINAKTRLPVDDPVEKVLRTGVIAGLANHTCLIAEDGTERQIADSASPLRDADGHLIGTVMVFRDVTDEYRIASDLSESKRMLDLALRAAVMGVWEWEIATERIKWAGEHAALFGIPIEEFDGTIDAVEARVHPEDREQYMESFRRTVQENPDFDSIYRIVRPDGSIRWMHSYGKLIRNEDGKPERIVGTTRDITERKKTEDALRESEHRFRSFVENAGEIVYALTPEGIFSYVSPNWTEFMAEPPEMAVGRSYESYVHPDDVPLCHQFLENILKDKGRPNRVEYRVIRKDGECRWHTSTASLHRDKSGLPVSFVGIARDITDYKRAEEERERFQVQLRHAQKMEVVGTLAGGVAHDFNNLLQAVIGYTQILLMDKKKNNPDLPRLNAIRHAADRAADLVRQLLTFSRKADTDLIPLDLNREVEHARQILESTIPKMIDIVIRLTGDLWMIKADPVQIEQIILNLGTNAADAMPDGGKLFIETENITLDEEYARSHLGAEPGTYVLLTVSDTGHGMDKETIEHIFDPFFTTKEIGKGTGLGLASVYGIVKSHGGYIMCYSEVGQGTTFKIYLPATEQPDMETTAIISDPPRRGTETVLLVDDEELIRSFASQALREFGYTVITASSGEDALQIYAHKPGEIDLVIMDIGMPGMGGHKCLQEMIRMNPAAKVIISSGYSVNGQVRKSMEIGAYGYVGKPYQLTDLLNKVREVLDEKK